MKKNENIYWSSDEGNNFIAEMAAAAFVTKTCPPHRTNAIMCGV